MTEEGMEYDEIILQIRNYEKKQAVLEDKCAQITNKIKLIEIEQSKLEKKIHSYSKNLETKDARIEQLNKRNMEARLKDYNDFEMFNLINEKQITLNEEIRRLRYENRILKDIFNALSDALSIDSKIFNEILEVCEDLKDQALKSFLELIVYKIRQKKDEM
ncbi:hypothetical protein TUBRATIS_23150 [Tubulinosema ratisbonensis]|uniref:Uncharacterized protein n=1 Tax=Tubulinosema ratisbonensis TaxID=291195 RepID=A0A437AJ84_9MICR|nr:hypothetical protein TUBRATIS_23150 [Tubulinosema ratisbonensis]